MDKLDTHYDNCGRCPLSLVCMAGRLPKQIYEAEFHCKMCGLTRWREHRRPYAKLNRDLLFTTACPQTQEARKVTVCKKCYYRREAEIDKDPGNFGNPYAIRTSVHPWRR